MYIENQYANATSIAIINMFHMVLFYCGVEI